MTSTTTPPPITTSRARLGRDNGQFGGALMTRTVLVATVVVCVLSLALLPWLAPTAMGWLGVVLGLVLIAASLPLARQLVGPPGGGPP